ncbi:unnamed protein product [Adineta ricciae]|uniref:Uncharacterized protein n=1 Tax=Adineta ricciae TaxID=249248 RepID=A0A815LN23_ADIRI|nr:unnamed protein product [Adineta ricciae]
MYSINSCLLDYNVSGLRRGFGRLKDIRYEKVEPGKPSLIVNSSNFDKSEEAIFTSTNHVLKELNKVELRKRFVIVHTEKYIYIIGGYIYDHRVPARMRPSSDYKYDIQTCKLISTTALPNGAIGFGLCADTDCIYVVGGNDLTNKPLCDCYRLVVQNSGETWTKLSDLPAPTSGPGVGVYNGELHCIGGYDVLGNEFLPHGEYLVLRYLQNEPWQYRPEMEQSRARPLVFILPDSTTAQYNVYVAGGFKINSITQKPYLIPDVQVFTQQTQRWQGITTIPDLEITHELSFDKNMLHVTETIEMPNATPKTNLLRSFDIINRVWTDKPNESVHRQLQEQDPKSMTSSTIIKSNTVKMVLILFLAFVLIQCITSLPSTPLEEKDPACIAKKWLSNTMDRNRRASISRPYFQHWRGSREDIRFGLKPMIAYSPRLGKRSYDYQPATVSADVPSLLTDVVDHITEEPAEVVYEDSTIICFSSPISDALMQELLGKHHVNQRR